MNEYRGIEEDVNQLKNDLSKYANEAWTKQDIVAGFKLLGIVAGVRGGVAAGFSILSLGIPVLNFLGLSITSTVVVRGIDNAIKDYSKMDSNERALVRKVINIGM